MKNILGLLFGLGCILLVSCNGADVEVISEAPAPMVETPAPAEETPAPVVETPATEEETLVAVETQAVEETYAEEPVMETETETEVETETETTKPVVETEVAQ